jgi:hypothetical protein
MVVAKSRRDEIIIATTYDGVDKSRRDEIIIATTYDGVANPEGMKLL